MIIGTVVRNQTPMIMTFDEDHVEFVCGHLAAMEQAYSIYAFFHDEEYIDD